MGLGKVLDSFVLVDDVYAHRWHDAWGDVSKYLPTAGIPSDDTTGEFDSWTDTETGTNTKVNSLTANSLFTAATGGTEYNGYSSQVKGEAIAAGTDKPFYVGGSFSVDDATQSDFLFGLAETDTTLTAASTAHAIAVSGAGFFFAKIDGSTTINFYIYSAGAEVTSISVGTMDTSLHEYEIYFDGQFVNVYFDGVKVGCSDVSIPTVATTPSLSVRAGSAAVRSFECKWMRAIQVYC
jgi:hypothetical protein